MFQDTLQASGLPFDVMGSVQSLSESAQASTELGALRSASPLLHRYRKHFCMACPKVRLS